MINWVLISVQLSTKFLERMKKNLGHINVITDGQYAKILMQGGAEFIEQSWQTVFSIFYYIYKKNGVWETDLDYNPFDLMRF